MKILFCCLALAAILTGIAHPAWSAPEANCRLELHLQPGEVIAYDGTYVLQIQAPNNERGLVLASVSFGLVMTVQSVEPSGATITAVYDRYESKVRQNQNGSAGNSSALGTAYRFRLTPFGQMELPAGANGTGWSNLGAIWPGWPAGSIRTGDHWRTESKTNLPGGGQTSMRREYRLLELKDQSSPPLALLDYTETGTMAGARVALSGKPAMLDGTILGVGRITFDLSLGVPVTAASISTLTGTARRDSAGAEAPSGQVRLEADLTLTLRQSPG